MNAEERGLNKMIFKIRANPRLSVAHYDLYSRTFETPSL
jgi:hypothetical protein